MVACCIVVACCLVRPEKVTVPLSAAIDQPSTATAARMTHLAPQSSTVRRRARRPCTLGPTTDGDIPFYKIGTFGKTPNAYISKDLYEEYKTKYSFPKKGDILISASGTIGRRVIYDGKPAFFQDSNIVWIDNDEKQVLNEYLYSFYGFCDWQPSKGATISRLYNANLKRIKITFPKSLQEQKIVN